MDVLPAAHAAAMLAKMPPLQRHLGAGPCLQRHTTGEMFMR